MTGIFNPEALSRIGHYCAGDMPWLGHTSNEPGQCGEHLRVVQRGASNVYFPLTTSSIYLPVGSEEETRAINSILENSKFWGMLTSGLEDGRYIQSARSEAIAIVHGIDPGELLQAAQRKLDRTPVESATQSGTEEEFRRQEYNALRDGRGGESFDLLVEPRNGSEYGIDLAEILKAVGLVRKLRETRVLVGFSRVLPVEDPTSADRAPISLANGMNWLPAIVVYGEGIFIDFDENRLDAWMTDPHVENRISYLSERYNLSRNERGMSEVRVTPKYVLLHTFAHSLIAQLSFDCGYGSAALRERIYYNTDDLNKTMQGVLIYTASGDSEGTMGGLVRQGEPDRLRDVINRAIYQAHWCSSDPVCIESVGQGTDNANLAACHGCILLPETSCETGNRLLDRGLLVGTQDAPGSGFFSRVS